ESVHRLVAHAFVEGKRIPNFHVAHLDGNPANNFAENLKVCSAKENNSHKKLHGTSCEGERNYHAKLQEWQVEEVLFLASKSIPHGKIAALFDVSHKHISAIVTKRVWGHLSSRQDVPALVEALRAATCNLNEIACENPSEGMRNNPCCKAGLAIKEIEKALGLVNENRNL
ncbi:MAG: hypothetical protein DRN30_00795, partial [Thermoplasmata archaeon]